jgi:hypothetical protein
MAHEVSSLQIVISMGRRLVAQGCRPILDMHYDRLVLLESLTNILSDENAVAFALCRHILNG